MSKELVRSPQLPEAAGPNSPDSIRRIEEKNLELPGLIAAGDRDAIRSVIAKADRAAALAKEMQCEAEAEALQRQAVEWAAAIGQIDVNEGAKSAFAALAAAKDRGRLEAVLNACEGHVTVSRAVRFAQAMGMSFVARSFVDKRIRQRAAERGVSVYELERQMELPPNRLSGLLRNRQGASSAKYWTAKATMAALGFDLRSAPPLKNYKYRGAKGGRSKWQTHSLPKGPGTWQHLGQLLVQVRDTARRADTNPWDKPAFAEHMHGLLDIARREIINEEKAAKRQ